ncbi:hypothetical protein HYPBUDRAFT_114957 [Hyphopichia burtonii NRRL Y-1933]|uniref:Zn(2)-C6 fungal-type domain-containing protein n=1 Tax=Hyphopichia burtonii NRRL Y-1933 TaxID=984485 RepID=A0A1E4RCI5_9ASCO|nr:hypothetical protein HYPBUDRAFT_114957 [Hyphopichia burtonii NRRL Y-1933]ODV64962.1 hypothetical protein HYPBUDRAFT_114957 [Hyphopichia burtonii NRRL Y-1933]
MDDDFNNLQHSISALKKEKGPRRRKHKNSKNGCPNCKRRRVKCSEDLPSCLNCIKHKTRCGYLDYNEDQILELKKSKDSDQDLSTLKPIKDLSLNNDDNNDSNRKKSPSSNENSPYYDDSPQPKSKSSRSSQLTSQSQLPSQSRPQSQPSQSPLHSHLTPQLPNSGVNDVLNFHSSITQDYHNLLPTNTDGQIIYPIYSINNNDSNNHIMNENSNNSHNSNDSNNSNNFHQARDVFGWDHEHHQNQLINQRVNSPQINSIHHPGDLPDHSVNDALDYDIDHPSSGNEGFHQQYNNQTEDHINLNQSKSNSISKLNLKGLPNCINQETSFPLFKKYNIDWGIELLNLLSKLTSKIQMGSAGLPQIRELYSYWLNSFIYKSYFSKVMFSCLINLTTNYLISNVLNIKSSLKSNFGDFVDNTRMKNILIVRSIKHYATVIKGMRNLLNNNEDPELCAQVSYILSLMSIYDPEATLESTNCFRDGLFGILSYTINHAIKNQVNPPTLIPIHLHLMTNVSRSIYLPGYNPQFLNEFQSMLISFGNIIKMINLQVESSNNKNQTLKILEPMYNDLMSFVNDSINDYLPKLTNNLKDIDIQQQTLFKMAHRWVRLQNSRLTTINSKYDPLEKILYLFYKVFKKSVFAVAPQVKYFFLRDFDSPLMLDVFPIYHDINIYENELDHPLTLCLPTPIYESIKVQLKILSSYLLRLMTFFTFRLKMLYRTIVYEKTAKDLYPIDNIKEWRSSIQDIDAIRKDFNFKIGIVETQLTSFSDCLIKSENYPRVIDGDRNMVEQESPFIKNENLLEHISSQSSSRSHSQSRTPSVTDSERSERSLEDDYVDLLTLTSYGLLAKDAKPKLRL